MHPKKDINKMEDYETRQFIIFNVSELSLIDFAQVCETSENTIRKSIDGVKTFVKWNDETVPSSVENLTTKEGPYTYYEMKDILSTEEWTSNKGML